IAVQAVLLREVVLDVTGTLINVHWRCSRSKKCGRTVDGSVGCGNQGCKRFHGRDRARGNRIELVLRKYHGAGAQALAMPLSFVGGIEECLVFKDRAAYSATELVALKWALGNRCAGGTETGIKRVARIEHIVSDVVI